MERDNIITFGLTGGIASGKSAVTKTFEYLGVPVVDADLVARQVVEPGTYGLSILTKTFGKEYLQSDGTLDRTKLGKLIFAHTLARKALDIIMLPLVTEESSKQIQSLHDKGHKIVGYDAALLIESGNAYKYNPLIVVHCPQDMQIERLMKRNGLTREEAVARIESQMPVDRKVAMADYTINTTGSIEDSKLQTKQIAFQMRKGLGRFCFDCGREYETGDLTIMCEVCGYVSI